MPGLSVSFQAPGLELPALTELEELNIATDAPDPPNAAQDDLGDDDYWAQIEREAAAVRAAKGSKSAALVQPAQDPEQLIRSSISSEQPMTGASGTANCHSTIDILAPTAQAGDHESVLEPTPQADENLLDPVVTAATNVSESPAGSGAYSSQDSALVPLELVDVESLSLLAWPGSPQAWPITTSW